VKQAIDAAENNIAEELEQYLSLLKENSDD
jgi:hypothetical protein